jgi:type VI secretion system protein ImpH
VTQEVSTRFSFFQLVRLLERTSPNCAPVGHLGPVAREVVRLRHEPQFAFAASDVTRVCEKANRTHVTTAFIGLTGATTPLAICFAEDVIRGADPDDDSLAAFYDLFHHRIISFLYRSWVKYRPLPQFQSTGADPFTRRALSLIGTTADVPAANGTLSPFEQLALAPIFAGRARSARSLELVLRRVFPEVGIAIESFVDRKVVFDPNERMRLGQHHTNINRDLTIGRSVRDRSGRFRIKVGPVSQETSERFLPGGQDYPRLRGIVEHFTRGVLEAEVEIELDASASPRFCIGATVGARLGVTTRLGSRTQGRTKLRVLLSDDIADLRPTMVTEA